VISFISSRISTVDLLKGEFIRTSVSLLSPKSGESITGI
jgi:hypothetical protein